jgi:hypothetical protein
MVTDQNGFPAPRPGNPYFVKGVAFEAATSVNGRYRVTALNVQEVPLETLVVDHAARIPTDN